MVKAHLVVWIKPKSAAWVLLGIEKVKKVTMCKDVKSVKESKKFSEQEVEVARFEKEFMKEFKKKQSEKEFKTEVEKGDFAKSRRK